MGDDLRYKHQVADEPPSVLSAAMTSSSLAPSKYIRVQGITRLNPDYQRWKEETSQEDYSYISTVSSVAIPIISTMDDYNSLNQSVVMAEVIPLAESTTATMEILQEPEICVSAGQSSDTMFQQLTLLLAKYEVPMGLINKLFLLGEYDALEFIIDDSESMALPTDALDRMGKPQSRWQEAEHRLQELMEIIAHVPVQTIELYFLNRKDRITVSRNGRDPPTLMRHLHDRMRAAFQMPPQGSTPIRERLQESFRAAQGKAVARYLFCDGVPNGGPSARRHLLNLLQNRSEPERNPIALMSCTDQDDQVEWMKDAEEVVPYCAEYDDYHDERREVLRDQGEALPFTKGFYLIAQLVGAMSPDDLDAMDESVPFTKTTLDNLLGVAHNNATYQHYYSCFITAQQKRPVKKDNLGRPNESDQLKKNFPWQNHYQAFLTFPVAKEIPAVQQFQSRLEQLDEDWRLRSTERPTRFEPSLEI